MGNTSLQGNPKPELSKPCHHSVSEGLNTEGKPQMTDEPGAAILNAHGISFLLFSANQEAAEVEHLGHT